MNRLSKLSSGKKMLPLLFIFSAFGILLFLSCNKQERTQENPSATLPEYKGYDIALKHIAGELQRIDNETHFMTKVPAGSVIEYEKLSYRKEIKDSAGVLIFPVKTQAAYLEYLLKTSFDSTLTLWNTQVIYYQDALKAAHNRGDSLKIAGMFYIFGNRGYDVPLVCDSLYKSSIPKKSVSKWVSAQSLSSTATCENYINLSLDMTFYSTSCTAGNMEQLGWQVVDYMCQQLQQQVTAELNQGVFVQNVPGLGIRIAGPVDVVKYLTGYELSNRLQTIASAIPVNSYSLFGCTLRDVNTTFPEVVGGNCGDGGVVVPPADACAASCATQAGALYADAVVSSEILASEVLEAGEPLKKYKNPKWVALKNVTWHLRSEEKGMVKLINATEDKWQWESLEHDKMVFVGLSPGGTVTVESQTGTPSFVPGTPNVLFAGMELDFTVKYSVICDCDISKIYSPVVPYKANAVFDANPKHDR